MTTQPYDTYQWFIRYFGSSTITPISGANSQTLVVDYNTYAASYISVEVTLGANDYVSPEFLIDGWVFQGATVASTGDFTIGPFGETILCPGDTMYFELLQPYETNITWFKNGDTIQGNNTTILTVTEAGEYYVTGAPLVCPSYIQGPGVSLTVIDCPVGIEENVSNQIEIYPNPAENTIEIVNVKNGQEYFISDAIGKIVMSGKINSDKLLLNIESLPSGFYLFKSNSITARIIKR